MGWMGWMGWLGGASVTDTSIGTDTNVLMQMRAASQSSS
jgi:hypothetical protein